MDKNIYNNNLNYTTSEFIKKFGGKSNIIGEKIRLTSDYFKIDAGLLHSDPYNPSSSYEIPFEVAELLNCMIKIYERSIVRRKKFPSKGQLKLDAVTNYNKEIIELIENLPDYIKYIIKENSTYKYNYKILELSDILLDRLSLLLTIVFSRSNVSSGNVMSELIKSIDSWIDSYFEYYLATENLNLKESMFINIDEDNEFNFERNSKYSIEYVLKNSFNKILKEVDLRFYNNSKNIKIDSENYGYKLDYKREKRIANELKKYNLNEKELSYSNDFSEFKKILERTDCDENKKLNKIIIEKIDNKEFEKIEQLHKFIVDNENDKEEYREIYEKFLEVKLGDINRAKNIDRLYKRISNNANQTENYIFNKYREDIKELLHYFSVVYGKNIETAYKIGEKKYAKQVKDDIIEYNKDISGINILKYLLDNNTNKFLSFTKEKMKLEKNRCSIDFDKEISELYYKYIDIIMKSLLSKKSDFIENTIKSNSCDVKNIINDALGEIIFSRLKKEYNENEIETETKFSKKTL